MKIKLIIMDVDGVLTDGKLYFGSDGTEYKIFNVKDGMGITLAKSVRIKFAIITGRDSKSVQKRAEELRIDYVYQGVNDKLHVLQDIIIKENLNKEQVAFIGDDINDLILLENVGHTFAPYDAVDLVKHNVDTVVYQKGGDGTDREMIDSILKEQYKQKEIINKYINNKGKLRQ